MKDGIRFAERLANIWVDLLNTIAWGGNHPKQKPHMDQAVGSSFLPRSCKKVIEVYKFKQAFSKEVKSAIDDMKAIDVNGGIINQSKRTSSWRIMGLIQPSSGGISLGAPEQYGYLQRSWTWRSRCLVRLDGLLEKELARDDRRVGLVNIGARP